MTTNISNKLIIAISSRALFNLDESNTVFEKEGVDAYAKFQITHENEILKPGTAFQFAKKLLKLNEHGSFVEIILLSRNSADTGLRIFNSIQHYQLDITRAAFTSGESPYRYIAAFDSHLFLSANSLDVKNALQEGYAAATLLPSNVSNNDRAQLRIAFDGDSVLFSDEAEKIYQQHGLSAFSENEKLSAQTPLSGGPFKGFLAALNQIQTYFPAAQCPIRTALVTARGAPAHERVIRTLRAWNIRIDEAFFLGGLNKSEFLHAFGADIYFDDQIKNCELSAQHVATGHVPNGIMNVK